MAEIESEAARDLVDRLILDIEAVMLLQQTDPGIAAELKSRIFQSNEEPIVEFKRILQSERSVGTKGLFFVSAGEIIFASIMMLVGLSLISPSLLGFLTPEDLILFFESIDASLIQAGLYLSLVVLVDFAIAILMMIGAFYSLMQAALHLKQSGLTV